MSRSLAGLAVALCLALPGGAQAHGVGARSLGTGAQTVEFYYASGEPMAYVAVKLFAPGEAVPYIDGRADKEGRFAFLPGGPGAWTARAEDEEGHKVELTVQAGEAGNSPGGSLGGQFSPWRLALWFSLSANVLAAASWVRGRWPGMVQPAAQSGAP